MHYCDLLSVISALTLPLWLRFSSLKCMIISKCRCRLTEEGLNDCSDYGIVVITEETYQTVNVRTFISVGCHSQRKKNWDVISEISDLL